MSRVVDRAASIFLRAVLRRMKELGLNQTTLAARMKASRPYVTKVLKGDVSVTLRTASRFAKALQMDFIPVLTCSSVRSNPMEDMSDPKSLFPTYATGREFGVDNG